MICRKSDKEIKKAKQSMTAALVKYCAKDLRPFEVRKELYFLNQHGTLPLLAVPDPGQECVPCS